MSSCENQLNPLPEGLPEDLWKLILQNVPVKQRLGVCATVSKKLHKAAVAVTVTNELAVDLNNYRSGKEISEGFLQWLGQHGHLATALKVAGQRGQSARVCRTEVHRLPCPNLRQLQLSHCSVQLGPNSSHPGVLQVCTALTKLVLGSCKLVGGHTSLAALSAVSSLQDLQLSGISHYRRDNAHAKGLDAAVFSSLRQLTSLEVCDTEVHELQHISCLTKLQRLILTIDVTPSTTPGLDQLTGLHDLVLDNLELDPLSLHGHTGLQRLSLQGMTFVRDADDPEELLSLIGRQQQLQRLDVLIDFWESGWTAPSAPSLYSALSVSSNLQHLDMHWEEGTLPAGVWHEVVFRPGHKLAELQYFRFVCTRDDHVVGIEADETAFFSQQDVGALVSCCPALHFLQIPTLPGVQLTVLSQLTALKKLVINGADTTYCSSLSALSDLSSLSMLYCSTAVGRKISTAALLPLTTLRRLARLEVCDTEEGAWTFGVADYFSDGQPWWDEPDWWDDYQVEPPAPPVVEPDVWSQLAERLRAQLHL